MHCSRDERPGEISLFDEILTDQLASAKTLLVDVANASEANKAEVEEGAKLLRPRPASSHTTRQIFDAAVAARIGWIDPGLILDDKSLQRVLKRPGSPGCRATPAGTHAISVSRGLLAASSGIRCRPGNPWEKIRSRQTSGGDFAFPDCAVCRRSRRSRR